METAKAHYRIINPSKRPQRWHCARSTRSLKRNIMDLTHWSTVEGSSKSVPTEPNLPPVFPAVGTRKKVFQRVVQELAEDLYERGGIDIREAFIAGTFVPEKRGLYVGETKCCKGTKVMANADAAGFPVAAHVESASPLEVKLVEDTIDKGFTRYATDRLVGDKAYGSDRLDQRLS